MVTRNTECYKVELANKDRFKNSAQIYMQNLLNQNASISNDINLQAKLEDQEVLLKSLSTFYEFSCCINLNLKSVG